MQLPTVTAGLLWPLDMGEPAGEAFWNPALTRQPPCFCCHLSREVGDRWKESWNHYISSSACPDDVSHQGWKPSPEVHVLMHFCSQYCI